MRAIKILATFAFAAILFAWGGGDADEQDSRQPPDKTIGPVQCPASAPVCMAPIAR